MEIRRQRGRAEGRTRATLVLAAALGVALLGAGGCLERDGDCQRDADCPGGSLCVESICDIPSTDHSPTEGCDDAFEPNDTTATAKDVGPGAYGGLRLCAGEDDWLAVELGLDDRLDVRLFGDVDAGDLDLSLYSPFGTLLATSDSAGATEGIGGIRAKSPGRYLIRVFGFQGGAGRYRLEIEVTPADCGQNEPLPVERASAATALVAVSGLVLDAEEERFYRVLLGPGESLKVTSAVSPADAQIEVGLYRIDEQLLRPLVFANTLELRYGPTSATEPALLRVVNRTSGSTRVDIDVERSFSSDRLVGRIQGVIRYEDRPVSADGLGASVPEPVALARVELYRPTDGYVIASGQTDAAGRYGLNYVSYGSAPLSVRALARRDDAFARLVVQRDERCRETYAVRSAAVIDPASSATPEVDILAEVGGAAGAFNIYATLSEAFEFVRGLGYPPASRKLVAYWERGIRRSCGSCYDEIGDHILVGGSPGDPDEYDDPVLLHEFGHYYEVVYGRTDSPGGPHDGSPTTPTLAWSEGFATYLAAAIRGNPLYVDTVGPDTWSENIEDFVGLGTVGNDLDGDVSENLVSGLLWDLHDDSPGESFDQMARSNLDVLLPTRSYLGSTAYRDRGPSGVDLVDYLDGWSCLGLGGRPELDRLLAGHRFPYTGAGPGDCRQKPRAPLHLEIEATPIGPGETVRLVGRATAKAAGQGVRMRLRLPEGWTFESGSLAYTRASPVWPGDEARLVAWVRPGKSGAAVLSAALVGPGSRVRATARAWPGAVPAAKRGRRALSRRGRRLTVFGGPR